MALARRSGGLGRPSRNTRNEDIEYTPRRSIRSTRWQVNAGGHDYEILCTGPKFLDTRAQLGGGGAVDLVMHLFRFDFKHAVALLREKKL